MDIVLGVSLTPTTVRMVLVEGEKGDGATVDHDVFEVSASEGSAMSNAADQVVAAVLGTQESAEAGGHHLRSIGVTWTDHTDAAALRDALAARGIPDVMLVSELHAAGALAQAAGRAVGYSSTALLFLNRDTATLSVVRGEDGSVVKVLSRSLHSTDAMAVLGEMAAAVAGQDTAPDGMFVVGSGVDVAAVKAHLADLVGIPVSAPEESGLALARGAALASASAPMYEASTVGLAYSLDPDGPTAGAEALAAAETQLGPTALPNYVDVPDDLAGLDAEPPAVDEGRKPFLLVGSAMASIFVVGVVALAISLAVSIRPTADERPAPARAAVAPSVQAPPPAAPAPEALPVQPVPPPAPEVAETIKAPVPVVQQAPAPRQVYVEAPAPQAPAPAPVAPPPAPVAPPPVVQPTVPPVWTPPVVLPPPVIVLPRPQWPDWRPPWEQKPERPDYDDDDDGPNWPDWGQQPQPTRPQPQPTRPQPQPQPQQPQWPQLPQWPGSGSGSGGGGSNVGSDGGGSRGESDYGRGESGRGGGGGQGGQGGQGGGGQGGNCFLIFCN
ncbi:DUF7159 family protein [Mycobacterium sp. C31M]